MGRMPARSSAMRAGPTDRLGWRSHLVAFASLCLGASCLVAGGYVSPACAQGLPAPSGGKPCPIREATVVVEFSLDPGGRVRDVRVVQRSGFQDLDREAVMLVKKASPFPAPPPDLAASQKRLTFRQPVTFRVPKCRS